MVENQGSLKPTKTGLLTETRQLFKHLKNVPGSLEDLFKSAKEYNSLEDALHQTLEYAYNYVVDIDETDAGDVRNFLDQIQAILLKYEQDPNLRQEAIAKARPDVDLRPDDDEPVVVALLVDLVSFTWPQDRLLTMLTRSMARSTFIDQTIIFQAPKWFTRWIELQYPYAGVDIKSIHDPVMRPEVLEVASELWQPLKSTSPYQSAEVAIRAGHQLV